MFPGVGLVALRALLREVMLSGHDSASVMLAPIATLGRAGLLGEFRLRDRRYRE